MPFGDEILAHGDEILAHGALSLEGGESTNVDWMPGWRDRGAVHTSDYLSGSARARARVWRGVWCAAP